MYTQKAVRVAPPSEGLPRALAVTTAASAVQDTGVTSPKYVTFTCNVDCYVTVSANGATVTDPDATATTGNGRTWPVWARQYVTFEVTKSSRYFKARGAESGTLRWYVG